MTTELQNLKTQIATFENEIKAQKNAKVVIKQLIKHR